jgi:hypothetical protein
LQTLQVEKSRGEEATYLISSTFSKSIELQDHNEIKKEEEFTSSKTINSRIKFILAIESVLSFRVEILNNIGQHR